MKEELACADRDAEPVLSRRQGTAPGVVVGAIRVVRAVEVELVLVAAERLRLDVASRAVRLGPARAIAEGDEELVALLERREPAALPAAVEADDADAAHLGRRFLSHIHL